MDEENHMKEDDWIDDEEENDVDDEEE